MWVWAGGRADSCHHRVTDMRPMRGTYNRGTHWGTLTFILLEFTRKYSRMVTTLSCMSPPLKAVSFLFSSSLSEGKNHKTHRHLLSPDPGCQGPCSRSLSPAWPRGWRWPLTSRWSSGWTSAVAVTSCVTCGPGWRPGVWVWGWLCPVWWSGAAAPGCSGQGSPGPGASSGSEAARTRTGTGRERTRSYAAETS